MENNSKPQLNTNVLMAVIMITMFFNAFMGAAINIAIPNIAKDFSMSAVGSSWVSMSFLLASAMFLLPFGKIGDLYGRKKLFLLGNIVFAFSSILCALSYNGFLLIASRFLQGIGGAMIMSTGMAIVTAVFPPKDRGKMLGLSVSAVYLGLTAAPVLGGILTQTFGWHSLFIVSAIAGLIVILGILFKIKAEWSEPDQFKFDIKGSMVYMCSVFLLMYGFSHLPSLLGVILSGSGIIGIVTFVIIELKVFSPVLNIKLFQQNRIFAFSNLAALINYAATFAITFVLSLFLQYAKGLSPREAGLLLITQPAIMALTASYAGRLSDKIDSRILSSLGMGIIVVGLVFLYFLDVQSSNVFLISSLIIVGLGFGTFSSPNTNSVMSSVEKKYLGVASATISTMRIMGQILSMAIAAMVMHIFLGDSKISKANMPQFIESSKVIFLIFVVLCFIGVFASLARGKVVKQ
jgi:EmrB/QacA subfamily drug resistance transporter